MPPVKPGNSDGNERHDQRPDTSGNGEATEPATVEPPAPAMADLEKAPPAPEEEPVMPTAREAARDRDDMERPTVLRVAFYLALASAVIGAVSGIYLILHKADLVSSAQSADAPQKLTADEAERAVTSLLWLYMVVVVALGVFLTLFAYKAQDGVRRARMMALIVTVILLLFYFYFAPTLFGQLSGLFAAVTIALMYLPSTRAYFGPRQTVR